MESVTSYFIPDSLNIVVGNEMFFANQSSNAVTFIWLINGKEFSNSKDAQYIFTNSGIYEITLIAKSNNSGCRSSYAIDVTVTCGIEATIFSSLSECKTGDFVNFNHQYSSGKMQEWRIDGTLISVNPTLNHQFITAGVHQVILSVWDSNYPQCVVSDTIAINVKCDAEATFIAPTNFPALGSQQMLKLTSAPKGKISWLVDGILISNLPTPNYNFNSIGSFQICATNEGDYCADTSCQIFFVSDTVKGNCNKEGLAVFGTTGNDEAYDIIQYHEKFIIAGSESNTPSLFLCDAQGKIEWKTKFNLFNGKPSVIRNILLDGDDLILNGYTLPYEDNFILKFSLINFSVVWCKIWDNTSPKDDVVVQVLKDSDFYYVLGQSYNNSQGLGCDAMFVKIQKSDGNIVLNNNFNLGSCETFIRSYLVGDAIYCVGRFNNAGGGTDKFRGSLTKLDLDGNYKWCRLYVKEPVTTSARLYSNDLFIKNGKILVAGFGDFTGTTLNDVLIYLIQTDLNGKADWQKQYEFSGINSENIYSIDQGDDGIYFLGNATRNGGLDILVFKTDFEGIVKWAKIIDGGKNETAFQNYWVDGRIHIVGKTASKGFGGDDILYFSMSADGTLTENDCFTSTDIPVQTGLIANAYDGLVSLKPLTITPPIIAKNLQPNTSTILRSPDCNIVCKDTCINGVVLHSAPDVVIQEATSYCQNKKIYLKITLCNLDSVTLPKGNPIAIYDNDPFQKKANLVLQLFTDRDVLPFSCYDLEIETSLLPNANYYLLANDSGEKEPPLNINTQFPTTGIEECDYLNNLFELNIKIPESPKLNLGPDITVCANSVVNLSANHVFSSYTWSDGGREITTTVGDPGIYWLKVEDGCGFEQTDTLVVIQLPNSTINLADTLITCENNLSVTVEGVFNSFYWYPPGVMNCDTCQQTTLKNAQSQMLYVVAQKNGDCISTDSVFLKVNKNSRSTQLADLCQGDTLYFAGEKFIQGGHQSLTLQNLQGCDSIVDLIISILPKPNANFEVTASCQTLASGKISWFPLPNQQLWMNGQLSASTTIDNLPPDNYRIKILDINGCQLDTILKVNSYDKPDFETIIFPPSCANIAGGAIYFVNNLEIYDGDENYLGSDSIINLAAGEYGLKLKNDESPCFWDTSFIIPTYVDTLSVWYEDTIFLTGGSAHMVDLVHNANSPTFQWYPTEGLSCVDCENPEIRPLENTTYSVSVTDEFGCIATRNITFIVLRNVEISNVVKLNSGENGKLVLYNLANKRNIQLQIYDRWGNLVHKFTGERNAADVYSWDGTLNGKNVEEGVYTGFFQYQDEKGSLVKKTFDVTILR
ncbi:MAG: gliding motility-associated C-terminal domain-containing protein [Saprospiraceae bacterium]|nr:gliding motility-associated C-terminal domain-containing protein [Saprospiraceae bacterium]